MQRTAGPGHGDFTVLQGLAHGLQHVPVELRQFVQKQHAVMGQGDLSGPHGGAAACQRRGGGGVVGAAEGPAGQQRMLRVRQTRYGPDAGDLQRLGAGQVRQNGGQALGQHGLTGAGRADEQQVMAARRGDLQRPLDVFLAHDVPQVGKGTVILLRFPWGSGGETGFAPEMGHQGIHIRDAVDGQAVGQSGLGGVFGGDEELADASLLCRHGHGQYAADAPQGTGEGQLADEGGVRGQGRQVAVCRQNTDEDGQVVDRARFFLPGGGQIDRDTADGKFGAAVFHRGPDSLPGLPHGGVRQAHHVEGRQAAGEEALRADLVAGDARKPQGTYRDYHIFVPPA